MVPAAPEIETPTSGWAPLRRPLFRNRLIASIVSNVGSWMQDTAGTWLMTTLTGSPLLIALMQTAASLPVLMLGFPAGATADIYDRRRLLLLWQTWMLITVAVLSVLTFSGWVTPVALLLLTFLLNIGSAMNNPAWQAIVPELVPASELPDAIAINSAGFNLARAVGPALGGLVVAGFVSAQQGAGIVFLFNSVSFVAVLLVLYFWKRVPLFKSALPAERVLGSMRAGVRYIRYAPALRSVLLRAFLFTTFASAVWALLAVVAQQDLRQGPLGYGVLNGCLGFGAVIGASLLPRMRRMFVPDQIVITANVIFGLTLAVLALSRFTPLILICLIAAGFAWTSTTSTFNVAVQTSVPGWIQARALGAYQVVFAGGMAIGSAMWGALAEHFSTPHTLLAAAAAMIVVTPLGRRVPLPEVVPGSLAPMRTSPPAPKVTIKPERGPILLSVDYSIKPEDHEAFIHAVHQLREVRMRDGAMRWGVFQDAANPDRFIETFVVESWLDYLRVRERMTTADRELREQVWRFNTGDEPPRISYMIYAQESNRES